MDIGTNIETLLQQAAKYLEQAIDDDPNRNHVLPANLATACATLAHAMIEYEWWQDERLDVERAQLRALHSYDSPF